MELLDRISDYFVHMNQVREAKKIVREYEKDSIVYNKEHHNLSVARGMETREVIDAYFTLDLERLKNMSTG